MTNKGRVKIPAITLEITRPLRAVYAVTTVLREPFFMFYRQLGSGTPLFGVLCSVRD